MFVNSLICDKTICGSCSLTDGMIYTSNPPQVKCTISGKFHYRSDSCDLNDEESNEVKDD